MVRVTERIFKGNKLIGYTVVDVTTGEKKQLGKYELWYLAKSKEVMNVKATGSEDDPVLTGVNGFQLKQLPETQWKEISKNLMVTKILTDDVTHQKSIVLNSSDEDGVFKTIKGIVGYRIKNIGSQPIEIVKVTIKDYVQETMVLNPGCEVNLSKMELGFTCNLVGTTLNNGKVVSYASKKVDNPYKVLQQIKVEFNNREYNGEHSPLRCPISKAETPENIWKYFCIKDTSNNNNTEVKKAVPSSSTEAKKKVTPLNHQKATFKDIMQHFRR